MVNHQRSSPQMLLVLTPPHGVNHYLNLVSPALQINLYLHVVRVQLALVYTATMTPYEIALLNPEFNSLFLANRAVDLIFSLDIAVNFLMMTEKKAGRSIHGSTWVTSPREIAKNYLRTWFLLDFISVAVSFFDVHAVLAQEVWESVTPSEALQRVTMLKTLRILRLFKLVKLIRASRIAKRWETRVAVDYAMLSIFKCIVTMCIATHWMACVWILQAYVFQKSPIQSWMGTFGYCSASTEVAEGFTCMPPGMVYWAALYWSVMTLTSVGYGDVAATPYNVPEQAVAVAIMIIGSLIYAQIIGTYCGVVATLNPEVAEFRSEMDDLNRFMSREGLPNEMKRRLREYFHQAKHLRLADAQKTLLSHMPPSLKAEVVWETNEAWLSKIWFLRTAPKSFLAELSMALNAMVFPPGDQPKVGFLYIVHRGIAIYRAKLITKGRVFGEDMILSSPALRSNAQAKAMNYLEVYFTGRAELLFIARRYPRTAQSIRRAAVFLALRREVIYLAKLKLGLSSGDKIGAAVNLMISATSTSPSKHVLHAGQLALLSEKELASLRDAAAKEDGSIVGDKEAPEDLVPEEIPDDALITDDPPPLYPKKSSPARPQAKGGKRGVVSRQPTRALSPSRATPSPINGRMSPFVPYSGQVDNQQLVGMISTLQEELREEQAARKEAQQAAVKVQEALMARVDEVLFKLNTKHRHRHRQQADGTPLPLPEAAPYVWQPKTVNTVHSVTSVTMEDRFQDGEREAGRTRPHRAARRAARGEAVAAAAPAMYHPSAQAVANQAWLVSQAAAASPQRQQTTTPGGTDPRLVA